MVIRWGRRGVEADSGKKDVEGVKKCAGCVAAR